MHAESSTRWSRLLTIFIPVLALAGCGEGDGPTRISGTAVTPLPDDFVPTLGVYSETHTDPAVSLIDIQQAGNEVFITTETVRVFEGAVSLGLRFTTGGEFFGGATILFNDADISSYNTLKFSIDTSSFANFADLTVQLEPPAGGTSGAGVALADYTPVATSGNWETYEIPLPDLPAVNLTLVNKLGFFNARDGAGTLLAGTLYLDDIHFTTTDLGDLGAAGTPIDPEVVLYATEGDPDLVIPDDYDDVSDLGSGSVPDLFYADDDTYSKVLSVFSGTSSGANVAKVGFIGFDPGFVTFYEDLIFKVKGMPNFVVFVSLYEGGDPLRINLTSSDFSEALENGWYQVSIPLSSFTGLTTATGIVFESDDTASMQFTMLLTDIGFTEGDVGDCENGGATDVVVFADDYGTGVSFEPFEGSVNVLTVDTTEAYSGSASLKVEVPASGYTGGSLVVSPALDLSGYDTVTFWAKASGQPRTLNVAGYGVDPREGGDSSNQFEVTDLALTTTWTQYTIDLQNPSVLTDNAGLFHFAEGDQEGAYTIWFDEITYISSSGGGVDCGDDGDGGATDVVVFADDYGTGVSFEPFEGSVNVLTVDTTEAYSGSASLKVEVPASGYTGGSLVVSPALDLSGYDTVTFWAKASGQPRTLNVAGYGVDPREGGDSSNQFEVTDLALTTTWTQYTIDLQNPSVLTDNAGLFHFAEGDQEGAYTIWFDDIIYASSGSSGGGNGGDGELLTNGDFEAGDLSGYEVFVANGGAVTAVNSENNTPGGTWSANANSSGAFASSVLKVSFLFEGTVVTNDTVNVSFDIKGTAVDGAVINPKLIAEGAGEAAVGYELAQATATPDWSNYMQSQIVDADVTRGVSFEIAVVCGGAASCVGDVFIDNISVTLN